jgi:hypothetical protein
VVVAALAATSRSWRGAAAGQRRWRRPGRRARTDRARRRPRPPNPRRETVVGARGFEPRIRAATWRSKTATSHDLNWLPGVLIPTRPGSSLPCSFFWATVASRKLPGGLVPRALVCGRSREPERARPSHARTPARPPARPRSAGRGGTGVMELARRGQRPVWRRISSTPSASLSTFETLQEARGVSLLPVERGRLGRLAQQIPSKYDNQLKSR